MEAVKVGPLVDLGITQQVSLVDLGITQQVSSEHRGSL
jgi:hypothetical protein